MVNPSLPEAKVILITGSSSGFGFLIAARLAACGHHVFATMRNLNKRQALFDELQQRHAAVEVLPLDVTDVASITAAIQYIQTKYNRIDVLVNNAGYGIGGFFEDLTQEEICAQLDTNFFGVQNVTRAVIPLMRRQGQGKIINISSIAGLYALPGFGAYNASKWALEGFSESLYYEMKLFGINVCLVEPGTYRTTIFYGNKRYAKNYNNPQSPYYRYSKYFSEEVDKYVAADKKDPEDIAILVERLVHTQNPPLRNIPDRRSKLLFALKRFLPFRVFSGLLYTLLFSRMPKTR